MFAGAVPPVGLCKRYSKHQSLGGISGDAIAGVAGPGEVYEVRWFCRAPGACEGAE